MPIHARSHAAEGPRMQPPPVLDESSNHDPLPHQLPGQRHEYSLARVFRCITEPHRFTSSIGGMEAEVSAEIAKRHGRHSRAGGGQSGLWIPYDATVQSRSLSTAAGVGAAG